MLQGDLCGSVRIHPHACEYPGWETNMSASVYVYVRERKS